jgi:23S rRNA (uracil1939-C5)-methyltransferase
MTKVDDVVELKIDSIAFEGKAVARYDDYVIFVSGGVPGDLVKAKVYRRKRNYAEAKVVEVLEPSHFRVTPRCSYFGICGGCKWQDLDYDQQLGFKRQNVIDAFERIGGLKVDVLETIGSAQTYEYRNKIEMTFSENSFYVSKERNPEDSTNETLRLQRDFENDKHRAVLGFHMPGRYDKTIDIHNCHLVDRNVNDVIAWFRKLFSADSSLKENLGLTIYNSKNHSGLLRFLTVRKSFATDEIMAIVTILNESDVIDKVAIELKKALPFVSSFVSVINPARAQIASGKLWKVHFGSGYITDRIGKYLFRISPLSFFQTNTNQAQRLYDVIAESIDGKHKVIYDLYSGTGSISLYLSEFAEQIYGFEIVDSSVRDAEQNAALNGVKNTKFILTDLLELFKTGDPLGYLLKHNLPKPDVVILDPPRSGLHPKISAAIHLLDANKIIYVSCNPSTQARDAKEIASHRYAPIKAQPIDMFPQTHHIENILTLEKIYA